MSVIASQITGVSIVCLTVCSSADQWKQRSSASQAFVRGIHQWPVDFPSQRASKMKNVSIWWCHHAWCLPSWDSCMAKLCSWQVFSSVQWRHDGCDSISNHQPHDCFLNRLFRHRSKKTSKLHITGLCAGISPEAGEFPAHKWPVMRKMFPFDHVHTDLQQCG